MLSIQNLLGQALQLHKAGRIQEAASLYRQALILDPHQPDATHLLGLTALQQGDAATAVDLIGRAAGRAPQNPLFQHNLGNAHAAAGAFHDAAKAFRRAIALAPKYVEAHANLGVALARARKLDDAAASLRRAVSIDPSYAPAYFTLANVLAERSRDVEALENYERALSCGLNTAEVHLGRARALLRVGRRDEAAAAVERILGNPIPTLSLLRELGVLLFDCGLPAKAEQLLRDVVRRAPDDIPALLLIATISQSDGRRSDAEATLQTAVSIDPRNAEAHNRLGTLLLERGELEQARARFAQALSIDNDFAEAHCNLAVVSIRRHELDDAIAHCERALAIKPTLAEAHNNIAHAHQSRGDIGAAAASYRRALEIDPRYSDAHSNSLLCLSYDPEIDAGEIRDAHRRWAAAQTGHIAPFPSRDYAANQKPRLRLGFVSADFRRHPVGYFLAGLFTNFDRATFELFCYSSVGEADAMTHRLRSDSTSWRDVGGFSAEGLARLVRSDSVDMLIDLSGHTQGNKLPAFAHRPAPVQLTWAGYVGTTGLDAIDVLIADRFHVPAEFDPLYVEDVLRMPNGYVCYEPPSYAPPVGALPALRGAGITFGSFSIPSKINDRVLETWSRILLAVPNSRLLLKYRGMDDRAIRKRIDAALGRHGVDASRVQLEGRSSHESLLARYNDIDIALDTFPYSGGLTTCESLWMGVPVVTWPGERFASRHSLSHLSNVGLTETIGRDRGEYETIAVELAKDCAHLSRMRGRLRDQMAASPLCDARRFARDFEGAMQSAWRSRK
jgi:protein O-GlcNAc transferase